ncbi:MAG: 4Fe-4S binding protein [Desulfobulbaceae bacterium]|jgi:ferredoxin|nr:4Fe-4S binding protein [Desulfobulbaceae bacterium]
MEIEQVKLIYFSPTGTTRKILESIAQGISIENVEHINLTLPAGAHPTIPPFADELVIIGAPVYGGRLPVEAINRLKQLKANKTLAVPVVVYGNREFEDSLLELKNLAIELGFFPVAGGAFIGEHSFATKDLPIANGRPDSLDIQRAMEFGARIKERVTSLQSADRQMSLYIPGRFPYEGGARAMTIAPLTKEDTCTVCGTCAAVCPTAAIEINGRVTTQIDRCIRCCACIKSCPTDSRYWDDGMMKKIATWLNENCAARKEPQIFLADM